MTLSGKFYEDRKTRAIYLIYHTDGNNPPVPTQTPMVHMVNVTRGGSVFTVPQRYVSIPIRALNKFFTDKLSAPEPKIDVTEYVTSVD